MNQFSPTLQKALSPTIVLQIPEFFEAFTITKESKFKQF